MHLDGAFPWLLGVRCFCLRDETVCRGGEYFYIEPDARDGVDPHPETHDMAHASHAISNMHIHMHMHMLHMCACTCHLHMHMCEMSDVHVS